MKWYSAHVIMFVELKNAVQKRYPVWENIFLIKADSEDEAFAKAEEHGRSEEGDCGGSFLWGGEPARWVFAGVRKLTECLPADERPDDGTEVTYHELELTSREAVKDLAAGKPVRALLNDRFRDREDEAGDVGAEPKRGKRKRA